MIDGLKPYIAYKDSGVPWLGDVPEHWRLQSLGSLTTSVSQRNRPDLPLLSVVREKGVVCRSTMSDDENHNFVPDDLSNYKVVRKGNLVINKMKAWQGSLGVSAFDGIVSPAYYVFDFRLGDRRFGHTLFRSKPYTAFFARASDGVRIGQWDLSIDGMKRIPVVIPPSDDQIAIVQFLDHASRLIERYIRAKRKLIALLNEQKQAIIHRAVTRGLDHSVRLKPSGVEWLGDIPEHWEVARLKFVAAKIVDCLHATPKYSENGEFPTIRTADISPGVVRLSSARRIESNEYARWIERLEPKPGDILYSREGERFGIAACVPHGARLCISQRMMVFRIRPEYNSVFVMWLLNSKQVYAQACQDVTGATAPHVNVSTIRNYFLALPARDEQDTLVAEIERSTRGFNSAIANAASEIILLREYRTRLISDVVTGKLDVREAAANLPDEIDEAEPLEDTDALIEDEDAGDGDLDAITTIAEDNGE